MIEILHRHTGAVLRRVDASTLASANLRGADLRVAQLFGANLRNADLRGADLRDAYLRDADLRDAYLRDADLRDADLRGAYLRDAYLDGALIPWASHDVVAELLRRAAGDHVDRLQVAGLVLLQRTWCWDDFVALDHPLTDWALDTLAPYVRDDDAPVVLRERAAPRPGGAS